MRRSGLWWAADHKGEERVAEVMEYIGLCTTRRESNQLLMKMAWRPRCTENDFNWMAASKFHITPSNNNTTAATMGGNSALKWWDCLELGAVDCGTLIDTFTWGELHSAVVYLDCLCWVAVGHDSWFMRTSISDSILSSVPVWVDENQQKNLTRAYVDGVA